MYDLWPLRKSIRARGNTIYLIYLKIVTAIQLWLPYETQYYIDK
jgi:hypothetical protein